MKKDEAEKETTQTFNPIILEIFQNTCKIIITENLPTPDFTHCVNTIQNTLAYLKSHRKHDAKND